jgi:hypothetical protein
MDEGSNNELWFWCVSSLAYYLPFSVISLQAEDFVNLHYLVVCDYRGWNFIHAFCKLLNNFFHNYPTTAGSSSGTLATTVWTNDGALQCTYPKWTNGREQCSPLRYYTAPTIGLNNGRCQSIFKNLNFIIWTWMEIKIYMKFVAFVEIYNFVIQNFFIGNHFDAQIIHILFR